MGQRGFDGGDVANCLLAVPVRWSRPPMYGPCEAAQNLTAQSLPDHVLHVVQRCGVGILARAGDVRSLGQQPEVGAGGGLLCMGEGAATCAAAHRPRPGHATASHGREPARIPQDLLDGGSYRATFELPALHPRQGAPG